MSTLIRRKDHSLKEVNNLRWLLDHADEVTEFKVVSPKSVRVWIRNGRIEIPPLPMGQRADCIVIASLDHPIYLAYVTDFADSGVLKDFLNRPKFHHAPINWFGWWVGH